MGLLVLPKPQVFLLVLAVLLVAFLLGAARLAVDLVDLVRADLIADVALIAVLGCALTRITTGDPVLVGMLMVAALATQAVPLARGRRRPRPG